MPGTKRGSGVPGEEKKGFPGTKRGPNVPGEAGSGVVGAGDGAVGEGGVAVGEGDVAVGKGVGERGPIRPEGATGRISARFQLVSIFVHRAHNASRRRKKCWDCRRKCLSSVQQ